MRKTRRCPLCKKDRIKKEYSPSAWSGGGACRVCRNKQVRRWSVAHPDACKKIAQRWARRHRKQEQANAQRYRDRHRGDILLRLRKKNRASPDRVRNQHLKQYYSITLAEYTQMEREQDGRCPICGVRPVQLHVDHDHTTKKVRALLCSSCNVGLGHFRDNPSLLKKAAKYLEKHCK
jgi:hypothetical protein